MKQFTIWFLFIVWVMISIRVFNTFEPYIGIIMIILGSIGMYYIYKPKNIN